MKIELIGEEDIDNPIEFAERMTNEAIEIWNDNDWAKEINKNDVLVESKGVSGVFSESNILVMRSSGNIPVNDKKLFDFLTQAEGFAVLDPVSKTEDHKKEPLDVFSWRENTRLELALAEVNSFLMPKVEFLVLNAIDYEKLQFVSKSIVHPKHPSSSIFYSGSKTYAKDNSKKRALNTIALKVIKINENNSKLLVLNYVDMGIKKGKGASLYNFINKHFFPSLYKRIKTKYNAN